MTCSAVSRTRALGFAAMLCAAAIPEAAQADAPHDIQSSLRLWLDGLDVSGTDTSNGGGTNPTGGAQVTAWKDKSPNAFTAGEGTSYGTTTHSYPTYSAGSGVSFDGISNMLEVVGGVFASGVTVTDSDHFIVATTRAVQGQFLFFHGAPTSNPVGRISAHVPFSDNNIYWDHGTRVTASWPGNSSTTNKKYVYNLSSSTTGQKFIARDGVNLVSAAGSSSSTYAKPAGHTFYLATGYAGSIQFHSGVISEFIVYARKLKTAERNIIQSYLAAKHANPGGAGTANRYTNTTGYNYHVGGIGQESDGSLATGTSAGLTIANGSFLAAGNYVLAGLPALSPATGSTTADVPTGYKSRSQRVWFLNRTGTGTGSITLTVKLADLGVTATSGQRLSLLSRSATSGTFAALATTSYAGTGSVSFSISDPHAGYYALGLDPLPIPTAALTNVVQSDGVNSSNFKAIPNAVIKVSANMTNSGPGSPDANSTVFSVAIPTNTKFYLGDIGTAGGGPVNFAQGTTSSGLSYTYTALASTTDGLDFSNDSGASWTYTPTADAQQGDIAITNVRVKPAGTFSSGTSPNFPSFTITYGLLVK